MTLAKLKWYAARLAAMSPAEVAHRLREAALKQALARDQQDWQRFAKASTTFADLGALGDRLAAGAKTCAEAVAEVEAGHFHGLGRMSANGPGVWFRDPVSGAAWPGAERYCFAVDVRSTGQDRGDVKYVWEVNRLQMLHPLAAAIAADPQPERIDRLFALLDDWAVANPPFRGVNWFSGIELAMRMVTFTLVIAALPEEALTSARRAFLSRLIAAHAFWLHRYPSKFSSANNHLVAEGLGLLLAGLIAPGLPHAAAYEAEGRAILEAEAARQIFADGVGGEQSPTYQAFTMEMLAFGALVAGMLDRPLASIVPERLGAGARFLQTLMDTRGVCPNIGDNDEGRVIAAPPDREPRYVASVVAAVARLTGDPALLPPARDPHLRDALFAVPPLSGSAAAGVHVFREGGTSVVRTTMAGRAAVLTFDHGPLGYLKLAAHGHADALALWLSLDDRQVLIDAGTYLYHSGGALRNRLRSSLAHNTLTIAGASQSLPSSAFSWSLRTDGRLIEAHTGPDWSITGAHDGYRRRFGVSHRRTIRHLPDGVEIEDGLEGASGPLPVSLGFLLAPGYAASIDGSAIQVSRDGAPVLRMELPKGFAGELVTGRRETAQGLASAAFGHLTETVQIVLNGSMTGERVRTRLLVLPPTG